MAASPENQVIDQDLMRGVAASDPLAVGKLYDRFGSLVYRMAFQALPSRDEAEDAVQEVFIRLWRTAGRYDPQRAALVTWVMLISRRYLVDRLRRQRASLRATSLDERSVSSEIPGEGKPTSGNIAAGLGSAGPERDERFLLLMQRIDKLPELQRTVVTRAYLNGQTLRQIGEELNTPLGTIKSALSRALVRLRENELTEEPSL